MREDGRLVGGKGWKERVYNIEKWKKFLRTARNHHILHMPMEWMNECVLNSNKWLSSLQSPEEVSWWSRFVKCCRNAKLCLTVVPITKSGILFQRHTFTDNILLQVTEPSEWLRVKVGHCPVFSRDMLLWRKSFKTTKYPLCILTFWLTYVCTRVGTLIVATIYLQMIQNRYMFRSFTVLHCSHQHCVQPVASDVEVIGYL